MNLQRIFILARRVMRQIMRDMRTLALLIFVPMLVLTLGSMLFRAELEPPALGIVNEDTGVTIPMVGEMLLGEHIVNMLFDSEAFELKSLEQEEIDEWLQNGVVKGVLILQKDLSATFLSEHQVTLDLRLEGSDPNRSAFITARVTEAAMKAFAGLATGDALLGKGTTQLPVQINPSYLFADETFDVMDYVAPVYIAFLVMFFVFLLTCVSFLRERTQGTFERLMSTPVNRLEIVLGYMVGLGIFALLQVTVIILFTVWVIQINYLGSLALLFVIVTLLAMVGVNLGILASAFARTEFQVVQFVPLLIIPQALLGEVFWAIEDMPRHLQVIAHFMPITYANRALRDVMLKGWGLAEIWPNLALLAGIAALLLVLGALTMRREV